MWLLWAFLAAGLSAQDVEYCSPADPAQERLPHPALFIGSSSIARWVNLAQDVKAPGAIRCGYWGTQSADAIPRAKPVVLHYRPSEVVYYFGDNDLADEAHPKTPDDVLNNFKLFVAEVRAQPETASIPITFLSIKESPARWRLRQKILETNLKVCRYAETDPGLDFVDVFDALLKPDGMPNEAFFESDGLHLNEIGYREWGKLVRPLLAPGVRAVETNGCVWTHPADKGKLGN